MKRLLAQLIMMWGGCIMAVATTTPKAHIDFFEYQGKDAVFDQKVDTRRQYHNPILSGFYPDPSICRKGNDYYLVVSSFSYFPGIPIFHSTDLVNWEQIGHVLDRPSQLNVEGVRLNGGIYAPAISYNAANETFYLITTCVDCGGNVVVKTKDPRQGWSDPIPLPTVGGIDPAFFFDDNGQAYIIHNDAPQGTPEWDGHRAIWMHQYNLATDQTIGQPKVLLDAGVDRSTKPIWIEGPHIYKVNGYYYLMAAEGGTSVNHTEVVLRSKEVWGPYEPYKDNPILSQKGMPEDRANKVTSVGHADLIQTPQGDWWAVFLGCRPYEGNMYNTGRETYLLPVSWASGFPVILPKGKAVPVVADKKGLQPTVPNLFTGNFTWRDDFELNTLDNKWIFVRNPQGDWWRLRNGHLELDALARSIYNVTNPVMIARRQQHTTFEATTKLSFAPARERDMAGLVCYQNEKYNLTLGKTLRKGAPVISLQASQPQHHEVATIPIPAAYADAPVYLKVEGKGRYYSFYVAFEPNQWQVVAVNVDAGILSTQVAGGFTGVVLGLYASTAHQIPSLAKVYADYFPIGVAVSPVHLRGENAQLAQKHFTSITAENHMKPINLMRQGGGYHWDIADRIVQFAHTHGMQVRGHTLVWHNQTPAWFFTDAQGNDLDSAALYARLRVYMQDVLTHFKGKVYCWDVVNEALADDGQGLYRTDSPWYRICGEGYIERAFRMARQIDPNIKLFYNDYNMVNPAKRERALKMLKALQAKGVPIDGVGMQGHWNMNNTTRNDIQQALDAYSALGLAIHITELDLTVYGDYHGKAKDGHKPYERPFTPALEQQQAEVYRMFFEVFRANKDKISSVTFWGQADSHTWLDNFPVPNRKDYPLPFNMQLEPKESFWQIVDF